MVVLQLCFQVEESSVNISDVEGALAQFRRQLRVAKLLCSNQSWSNRTSAQKITVTLMSSGLYAKIRHAILILLNASVGDVREDLTNVSMAQKNKQTTERKSFDSLSQCFFCFW